MIFKIIFPVKKKQTKLWRRKFCPGTEEWCRCNANAELIKTRSPCEDQGGGRKNACVWWALRVFDRSISTDFFFGTCPGKEST
jgi:hypothetical protein